MTHNPRYRYDCERCKFNWNCGYGCDCVIKGEDPPQNIQDEVDMYRWWFDLSLEFKGN